MINESQLQEQVATYIRLQYKHAMFHSDFGSGIKLTCGQAVKQKRQNGGRRAWPDMFIAEPNDGKFGLFLELKREGTRLKKKDGTWASPHIEEQAEVLERLEFRGYEAKFAVGFEEAKEIIDNYLRRGGECTDTSF